MRESEGSKNKNKKIVMDNLVIQKKKPKSSVCLIKFLNLFLWHPILVLALDILSFMGKGAAPLVGQFNGDTAGGFFFHLSWTYGPSVTSEQVEALKLFHQVTSL
jgi:hypothetical protein